MVFVLNDVYFLLNNENNMILKSSSMTNYKELIKLENQEKKRLEKNYYQSSIHLTNKNIEITLSLKDQITIDLKSFTKTCLNLNIEIIDFDNLKGKHIYKIHRIEISENKQDIIEDDEPEKLLDFYEIKNIYDSLEKEIVENINSKKKKIQELENILSSLEISLENVDYMDNIKRNFDKYL